MIAYLLGAALLVLAVSGDDPEAYRPFCVNGQQKRCDRLANGDYPACSPECQKGVYITCSNGYTYRRDCALGWYVRSNGVRFTEKMVYDPRVKRCERKAQYCPRSLDAMIGK